MRDRRGWATGSAMLVSAIAAALGLAAAASAPEPLAPELPLEQGLSPAQAAALEEISVQPESLHPAIVEAAVNGQILVQLPNVWSDFEVAVQPILEQYDEDERRALQDLMRYPGLLEALVWDDESESPEDLDARLEAYPEQIRDVARTVATEHQRMLRSLVKQVDKADAGFERVIAGAPANTQQAFREIVAQPPLASLLLEQFDATEQLGGAARLDRAGTLKQLAEMRTVVLQRRKAAEERAARQRAAQEALKKAEAERKAQRRAERRRSRLYSGRYPYWGSSACWYGDPAFNRSWRWGSSRCWYPWRGYARPWW